jgi:hypothetical protein
MRHARVGEAAANVKRYKPGNGEAEPESSAAFPAVDPGSQLMVGGDVSEYRL